MLHRSLMFLLAMSTLFNLTAMANPCPCEVIANESLSSHLPTSAIDSSVDDETSEDYLGQYAVKYQPAMSAHHLQDFNDLHSFLRANKYFDSDRARYKRPSWAPVGKRSNTFRVNKRPSWAPVG
jgi:hypothetical protein